MPPNPEIKDSNLESTNPGLRDSSLTSPMTSLTLKRPLRNPMTIKHDAQILPTYSYLPDRDPRGFIRTGGSIPPWFFLFR